MLIPARALAARTRAPSETVFDVLLDGMYTCVEYTPVDVKRNDVRSSPGDHPPVTRLERFQQVLEKKIVPNATQWAKLAGLTPDNHVHQFLSRLAKDDDAQLAPNALFKLSFAAGVSPMWLWEGVGPMMLADLPKDSRYSVMSAVMAAAQAQGFAPAFIAEWDPQLDADTPPDFDTLWSMCKADHARWKGPKIKDRDVKGDKDL
jgi:hypothetical protein